ncbi:site-specific DNA-methyltransferase [Priestia megaterium]|uniref:site-specific DNA-methyltransferase n=1 Tax=Priestia megaterium TaxID=1404 RepID=UPI0021F4843E|nr:site-specific DNA-methyltransferase [Priestia megaterium]UYP07267.1 site-specific DNA-methyltransferase [Priestia megaterium]
MSIEELKKPERIDEERIKKLRDLFPEAFSDGKFNLTILQDEILGFNGDLVEENTEQFYGLQWAGKKEARKLAFIPPEGTLKMLENEGIDEKRTDNIFIEGDNLEVLRILQKSYAGKIKTIYIDPPYNTDNDYIYKDSFKESVDKYLQKTAQADEEGLLSSNPKASGRYHANWLSMMYPRLKLAWNLLCNDGIICVSISDIEEANLRKVLDEIFGEENYINTISIKSKVSAGASGGGEDKRLKKNIEYIHIYTKNINELSPLAHLYQHTDLMQLISDMREEEQSWKYTSVLVGFDERKKITTTRDGEGNPIDVYIRENIKRKTVNQIMKEEKLTEEEVYKKYLDRIFSDTNSQSSIRTRVIEACGNLENGKMYEVEYTPRSGKMRGQKVVHHYISNTVRRVIWLNDVVDEVDGTLYKRERLSTLWDDIEFNNIGKEGGIPYPNGKKPIELIKRCIKINDNSNGIILDFFAGSGSTGHAVLDMNAEDNGSRKFILVQLPEVPNGSEFKTIAELTKQRLRNSIDHLNAQDKNINELDRGFSVYKMDKTNLRKWETYKGNDIELLNQNLDLFTSVPFIEEANERDIVIELMLSQGFPLDSKIIKEELHTNSLWIIQNFEVPFSLVICLDQHLGNEASEFLSAHFEKSMFICLDSALSNQQKLILSEIINVRTI